MTKRKLEQLKTQGFDCSYRRRNGDIHVDCSQCQAIVINGMATHEHGCPNARHECKGCNEQIPVNQRYCQVC